MQHEIMGWGKLAGPRSPLEPRQVHGVELWAWRLCNLLPGPSPVQEGGSSNQRAWSHPPQAPAFNEGGTLAHAMARRLEIRLQEGLSTQAMGWWDKGRGS